MNVAAKNHADWEKELVELDEFINKARVAAIKEKNDGERQLLEQKIVDLEKGRDRYMEIMYKNLGDWEKVLVARAQKRPYTLDYVTALFQDFVELQGDRNGFADNAIIGGPALFEGQPVMIVGHQKGRNIQERQQRNFAMAKPEGYRKAIRLFDMADRFGMPVISFVDTPAADPGVESESRGISEAIAAAIMKMFEIRVPSVAVIIGEGGSGGAIGIAASSRVLMLEHSVYSVIPPEGCAAILWRMPEKGAEASKALKLTAQSAMGLGLIDEIISEPMGAAHRKPVEVFDSVREAIRRHLEELSKKSSDQIREERYAKFRSFGQFEEVNP
jgi:acetyl-CoA carboxylase carboxyl transferase subunit alpha